MFKPSEPLTLHFSLSKNHFFTEARLVWGFARPSEMPSGEKKRPKKAPEKKANEASEREVLRKEVENDRLLSELLKKRGKEVKAFIDLHGAPEMDYKPGDWRRWNKDFLIALSLPMNNDEVNQSLVRDLQVIIYKRVDRSNVPKADGKFGPNSLIALAKYANQDLPELAYTSSGPHREEMLTPDLGRYTEYHEAEKMLDISKEELFQDYLNVLMDEPEQAGDLFRESNMDQMNLFMEKIQDVFYANEGQIDTSTADGWRQAFKKAGLKDYEIEGMGLSAEPAGVDVKIERSKKTTPEVQINMELNSSAIHLVKNEIARFGNESQALYDAIKSEHSVSAARLQPSEAHYTVYQKIQVQAIQGAINDYRDAYLKWEPYRDAASGFEEPLRGRGEAYEKLKKVVEKYYQKLEEVTKMGNAYEKKYESELGQLAKKYYFPEDVSDQNLAVLQRKADAFSVKQTLLSKPIMEVAPVKTKGDLIKLMKGNNDFEKEENFKKIKNDLGVDDNGVVEAYNSRVYSVNVFNFKQAALQLSRQISNERDAEVNQIKAMTSDELLK